MRCIFSQGCIPESQCLHGISSFYIGMPILIVRMGKILLFARGAYFHSGMLIFTVKMGTWMPIFTHRDAYFYVKIVIRDAYIWGCLYSLDTCPTMAVPVFVGTKKKKNYLACRRSRKL